MSGELERNAELSVADVMHIARLSRIAMSEAEAEAERPRLGAVLHAMTTLGELDLTGVEPMTRPEGGQSTGNVLASDEPEEASSGVALRARWLGEAPSSHEGYLRVPRVLGGGGGA